MIKTCIVTFVNTFSYYKLLDSGLPVEKLDCIFVDGSLQVLLHNLFNKNKTTRASFDFSSLADDFFMFAEKARLRLALIGAREDEIKSAVSNLKQRYKDLQIPYFRNGYFNSEREKYNLCNTLPELAIDVVLLGMGTPAQEELAIYIKEKSACAYIFTCGGFIEQTAKNIDYYKPVVKKTGLRWMQRALEYSHVRKRLFFNYPKNIMRYVLEHCKL